MRFLLLDGNVEVSTKLLKECLLDWQDTYPDLEVVIEDTTPRSAAMEYVLDWVERNGMPFSLDKQATDAVPDRVYALIGDTDPDPRVGAYLKDCLDKGIEVRDLAEAGVTVVRIDGTVPTQTEGADMADEEVVNYTWVELGRQADDDGSDLQEQSQELINDEFEERGLDGDDFETWLDMAIVLGLQDGEDDAKALQPEETPEPEEEAKPQWTADDLKDIGVRKLKEIAKQSGIDPKLPREQIIALLVGGEDDVAPEVGGETFREVGPVVDEDALAERVAALVLAKLREALS